MGVKFTLICTLCALVLPQTSLGQSDNCPAGLPDGLCLSEAWQTVGLEHEDRIARLIRLAEGRLGFSFDTEVVTAADHGLVDFPTDIPVLRVTAAQDVFFDTGKSVIRREAYPLLEIISESLRNEPPDVAIFVAGHTDSRGSEEFNFTLGLERAEAVAEALVRRNVYQAEIYKISFGELMPIASNNTAGGRAQNRRVEFLFAGHSQAIVEVLQRQAVVLCNDRGLEAATPCRRSITLEAEQIGVTPTAREEILRLNRIEAELKLNSSIKAVEISQEQQAIELQRSVIPIEITVKRIPIELTSDSIPTANAAPPP